MLVNIILRDPLPASTNLVFGAEYAQPSVVTATLAAALADLEAVARIRYVYTATVDPVLPRFDAAFWLQYSSRTERPTVSRIAHLAQTARPFSVGAQARHDVSDRSGASTRTLWSTGGFFSVGAEHLSDNLTRTHSPLKTKYQTALSLQDQAFWPYQNAIRIKLALAALYQAAVRAQRQTAFYHQDGLRNARPQQVAVWQIAVSRFALAHSLHQLAGPLWVDGWSRYQAARPPQPGVYVPVPFVPPRVCYTPSGHLVFFTLAGKSLLFLCDGHRVYTPVTITVIPIKRAYIVINNLALRRVVDNVQVPAFDFRLSLDVDSWAWDFRAQLPASAQALVEPQDAPVELRAVVNGQEFRVLAEQLSRERVFGNETISISGRSRHAVLGEPYAPIQVFANSGNVRTHQQLFDDVLTVNGVPLGVIIDYGLSSWLIPAGVWSHQGTYASALAQLAEAAGAYLIPHPSDMAFKVQHRYPVAPWDWPMAVPDLVLPTAVVTREATQWQEKPGYNRVFVSGQEHGVLAVVTRSGTAGDVVAPMVTDALITDAVAARQRGLAVLGDTERKLEYALRLPVLPATGIIQPGTLVQYESRVGIVRSVELEATMPGVWQTLGVEVHLGA